METVSVSDFKARFSEILEEIKRGQEFTITYGRQKREVARIGPPPKKPTRRKKRKLGLYDGMPGFSISEDWKMTEDELLGG